MYVNCAYLDQYVHSSKGNDKVIRVNTGLDKGLGICSLQMPGQKQVLVLFTVSVSV